MPHRHFGKFDLLRSSLVDLILALVAEITAVVLLHLLSTPTSLGCHAWADGIGAAAGEHASVVVALSIL